MINTSISIICCSIAAGILGEAVTAAVFTADPLAWVLRFVEKHVSKTLSVCRYCFTAWACLAACFAVALISWEWRSLFIACVAWLPSWGVALAVRAGYDILMNARAESDAEARARFTHDDNEP